MDDSIVLKVQGAYSLTVEPSDFSTDNNGEGVLVYCVTNTETNVRELEDAFFASAHAHLDQLDKLWKEIMEPTVVLVPDSTVKVPTHFVTSRDQ